MQIKRLVELHQTFIKPQPRYAWKDLEELDLYDQFFGRRISWKWETILKETPITPPQNYEIVDWGCGTAVATEVFLSEIAPPPQTIKLWDKSVLSLDYSKKKLAEMGFKGEILVSEEITENSIVLISHVLNELDKKQLKKLMASLEKAHAIYWVEPGTYDVSQQLIRVREELMRDFNILAPCPHAISCPIDKHANHWCHQFAQVPNEVFQNREWSQFSRHVKIDLRSVPYSYLVLSKEKGISVASRSIGKHNTIECLENGKIEEKNPSGNPRRK